MDRPIYPPPPASHSSHNDRESSSSSRSSYPNHHSSHGHERDRPVFPPEQLIERAMRGDGQFFYPLNLMQQAAATPMHFNMDQFLQLASQSEGNHGNHMSSMSHPPNSVSQ